MKDLLEQIRQSAMEQLSRVDAGLRDGDAQVRRARRGRTGLEPARPLGKAAGRASDGNARAAGQRERNRDADPGTKKPENRRGTLEAMRETSR